jgi:hypothetical protein
VLIDRGAHDYLSGPAVEDDTMTVELPVQEAPALSKLIDRAADELSEISPYSEAGGYRFRRMPRRSVKGYSRLEPFVLRRARRSADD